jgi:CRISPR/Cas system CSM-associated protein Csm3 (group 7 of RAMP superfamily)
MTKGYERISIAENAANRQQLAANRGHHREASGNAISGTLEAQMRVVRPVHVGIGDLVIPSTLKPAPDNPHNAPLVAPFFRETDRVCVPGSSIKGAFRHLYETVTASCLAQADTGRSGRPVDNQLRSCSYRADSRSGRNDPNLCPTCRVFGAQGYLGQVFFHAAYPAENTKTEILFAPQRWSPRIIDEDSRKLYTHQSALNDEGQPYEQKEPLEVLPVGCAISLKMDFTSLLAPELGLLLLLMGQKADQKIYPKLGGVKAHGWGAIDIHDVVIHRMDENSYLTYERTPSVVEDIQFYFSSLEKTDLSDRDHASLLDRKAWSEVVKCLGNLSEADNA